MLVSEPRLTWLEDPEVFAVNRKEAHSDHVYYENTEEMVLGADMPLRQSLNGTWYFSYAKNPTVRVKDFYKKDFDCRMFDSIEVPGHIQTQGYDRCQYINTMYPWDGTEYLRPPMVSKEYNPVGSYVKYFVLEKNLQDKPVFVSFQFFYNILKHLHKFFDIVCIVNPVKILLPQLLAFHFIPLDFHQIIV